MGQYNRILSTPTPQTEQADPNQVKNNAGGYVFQTSPLTQLERFVLLGTIGGCYYVGETKHTQDNIKAVIDAITTAPTIAVRTILDIDLAGRAVKKSPTLLALALAVKHGDATCRSTVYAALPDFCRTASHLFEFLSYTKTIGKGWGRGLRQAVAKWYTTADAEGRLEYQYIKYGQRSGYTHRDVLRLAHPKSESALLKFIAGKGEAPTALLRTVAQLAELSTKELAAEITNFNLPREVVPTEKLNEVAVWKALLAKMPVTATIRNLGKMTSIGLLTDPEQQAIVTQRLTNVEILRKGRVHPLQVLQALTTYAKGQGDKGSLTWQPQVAITQALARAFDLSFEALPPTDLRILVGLDVSGSMNGYYAMGQKLHTLSGCMATCVLKQNPQAQTVIFDTNWQQFDIAGRRVDDIAQSLNAINGGGTDLAQPIAAALALPAASRPQVIIVYTDNETWAGRAHTHKVWEEYKKQVPGAKLVVVSMVANAWQSTAQNDNQVLQIVGFDSGVASAIQAFIGGQVSTDDDEE